MPNSWLQHVFENQRITSSVEDQRRRLGVARVIKLPANLIRQPTFEETSTRALREASKSVGDKGEKIRNSIIDAEMQDFLGGYASG